MKYEIHNDRIIMREEGGKAVAQIQYPEVGKGVCEIAHIYGENSPAGRRHADLLMEMAVAEIRKSGRKLIPGCAFATHWFTRHAGEQDIVTDWDTLKRMEQKLYGEPDPTKEMSPVKRQTAQSQEAEVARRRREQAHQEQFRREQEEKKQAILEDVWEEEEKVRKGEERLDSSLSVVLRVLQVISFICMAAVLVLFLTEAIRQKVYIAESFPQLICLGLSLFLVVFCVIQLFWILSRKRLRDEFGDKLDEKYDAGRGVFGFILVIIICFLCGLAINFIPEELVDFIGISQFSKVYQMRIMPIIYASIAGLVFCLIRKIAGRQLVK